LTLFLCALFVFIFLSLSPPPGILAQVQMTRFVNNIYIQTFAVQKTCGSMERSKLSGYKLNSKDCLLLFCFLIRLIMIENI